MNLNLKPIATHEGSAWSKGETTSVYVEKEYTKIEIEKRHPTGEMQARSEIKFRNVGEANFESSIQLEVTQYDYRSNRTKFISLSIPYPLCELFIERIKTLK